MILSIRKFGARAMRGIARRLDRSGLAEDPTHRLFTCIQRAGIAPKHLVDVGSNRGRWTRAGLKAFPDAHFTMLAPQAGMREHVADLIARPNVHYHTAGAGPVAGEMAFTIHERDDSCTFAMDAELARSRGFRQISAPVVRLDDILPQSGQPAPTIIKIDAEGYDLGVIDGSIQSIKQADVVLVEAGISNRHFGNNLQVVIQRMSELGHAPLDITDLNRTPTDGVLWLIEMAFVRRGSALDAYVQSYR